MFLSPRKAIDLGWITFPSTITDVEKYIQPNAIDITGDLFQKMVPSDELSIGAQVVVTEVNRSFPTFAPMKGPIYLLPQLVYDVMSDFRVNIPEGVAAMIFVRSSFSRCGVRLSSGLYDSGFANNIGFTLINHGVQPVLTAPGTRVAQIGFVASDSAKTYDGQWNAAQGEHWSKAAK